MVNWYAQDLPAQSSGTLSIPPAVRAKLLADQLVMQQAASSDAPIYSPGVGLAKIAAGALGGYMHAKELGDIQQKQAAAWAAMLGPDASAAPAPSPASPAAAAAMSPPTAGASPPPVDPNPGSATPPPVAQPDAAPPPAPAAAPAGFTPPPMSAAQLANAIDPSKGWADPGKVPTLGTPVPGVVPGSSPAPDAPPPMPPVVGSTPMGGPPAAPSAPQAPMAPPPGPPPRAPAPAGFSAGVNLDPATRAAYAKVLLDPYASDQQKAMVLQRLVPPVLPPEKLGPGEALINPNNGQRIENPPVGTWAMNENGLLTNSATGEVRTPNGERLPGTAPGQAGQGSQLNRPMTVKEKQEAGINPDYPAFINTITGKPTFGQPGMNVNVGADEDASKTVGKALFAPFKTFVGDDKVNAIEANSQSLADLQALQSYVNAVQAKGGTTGVGSTEITKMKGLANSLANQFGITTPFDVSDQEGLAKFARQLAVAQLAASAGSTGSRMTNMALDNALKSTPGNDISLLGNQRLLGLMIQQKQRSIEIGQQIRDWAASHQQAGTQKLDPREMYAIIDGYDKTHHPVDPLTGEDLTKVKNNPAGSPGSTPAPSAVAAPPPTVKAPPSGPPSVKTQFEYDALPRGTQYTAPDGSVRTKQ